MIPLCAAFLQLAQIYVFRFEAIDRRQGVSPRGIIHITWTGALPAGAVFLSVPAGQSVHFSLELHQLNAFVKQLGPHNLHPAALLILPVPVIQHVFSGSAGLIVFYSLFFPSKEIPRYLSLNVCLQKIGLLPCLVRQRDLCYNESVEKEPTRKPGQRQAGPAQRIQPAPRAEGRSRNWR